MRRLLLFVIIIFSFQIVVAPAKAIDSKIIRVVTEPNRNFSGFFYNDDLASRLAPTGDLGKIVYAPVLAPRTWVVDLAFIDDVLAMTSEYKIGLVGGEKIDGTGSEIASAWLNQFANITRSDSITVLPYGNPNYRLMKNYAPGELNFYYSLANQRLSQLLKRTVISDKAGTFSKGSLKANNNLRLAYYENRRSLTTLDRVVDAPELTTLRLQLARLLNSDIDNTFRDRLIKNATSEVSKFNKKLKVTSGRYRLTSKNVKIPITLVNKFSTPALVSLELIPRNSRVQLFGIDSVSIPANSKIQLSLEASVITPGTVTVAARLTDTTGVPVTKFAKLALNLSIVDARVAWFTSSAALLLFIAALAQTIRRIRRNRK
jgi:hypothetical protein